MAVHHAVQCQLTTMATVRSVFAMSFVAVVLLVYLYGLLQWHMSHVNMGLEGGY